MSSGGPRINKPSLFDQVSWFAQTFSTWSLAYFIRQPLSWRHLFTSHDQPKDVELEDLHRCSEQDEAATLLATFKVHRQHQLTGSQLRWPWSWIAPHGNIFVAILLRMFGAGMLAPLMLTLAQECLIKVFQPVLIGSIIAHFHGLANPNAASSSTLDCLVLIIVLCTSSLVMISLHHPSWILTMRLSMRVKILWTALVYDKCLRLAHSSASGLTHLVNLTTNDVRRFDEFALMSQYLLVVPLQTLLLLMLTWWYIGSACLGTFIAFVCLAYGLSYISRRLAFLRRQSTGHTEARLQLLAEVLRHLRAIKAYTLEESFLAKIFRGRYQELEKRSPPVVMQSALLSFSFVSSRIIFYFTFVVYHLLFGGHEYFHLETMFVSVAFFERLRYSLTWTLPQAISGLHDIIEACNRMNRLLLEEEHRPTLSSSDETSKTPSIAVSGLCTRPLADPSETKSFGLKDVSFEVTSGQVMSIIGPVGCGKSSLLLALLSEVNIDRVEQFQVFGSIAYVGQECYCLVGTIKENILFGSPWDKQKYAKVLSVCALEEDLAALPLGDDTRVGEHGLTLSGGQKARVGLARALYADKDIYLLDDPFSAVDVHLARHIYHEYITQALRNKVVILATHQLQLVPNCDRVLLLDRGQQIAFGDYQTLVSSNDQFSEMFCKLTQGKLPLVSETKVEANEAMKMAKVKQEAAKDKPEMLNEEPAEEKLAPPSHMLSEYWRYFRLGTGGRIAPLVLVIVTALLPQLLIHLCDHWLTLWDPNSGYNISHSFFIAIYTLIVVSLLGCSILRAYVFFGFCRQASERVHNTTIESIVKADISALNYVSTGRLLGHFARDIGVLDESLPLTWFELNLAFSQTVAIVFVAVFMLPSMCAVIVVYFYLLYVLRARFSWPSQCFRRLEASARNKIFDHLGTTMAGRVTIRAYGLGQTYRHTMACLLDDHTAVQFAQLSSIRLFCMLIDLIAFSFIAVIMLMTLATVDGEHSSLVAICFSSIFTLIGIVQWAWKRTIDSDYLFMSYLNLKTLADLPREETNEVFENVSEIDDSRETSSSIIMSHVSVTYHRHNIEHQALRSIDLVIKPGEKVGICGRSGSGKSTLVSTLLRFVDYDGEIQLGGRDLRHWPRALLRSHVSMIPQHPAIFTGSLRENLDLFNRHTTEELWRVLDKVHLREMVEGLPGQLDEPLGAEAEVMSLGQKQLLCLARILLQPTRLVMLDEPTASIDYYTDRLIQQTIREEFNKPETTIVMIAHRLDSIIDCQRILVFDDGRLVEDGAPAVLLNNTRGHFHQMVAETGKEMAARLIERARARA